MGRLVTSLRRLDASELAIAITAAVVGLAVTIGTLAWPPATDGNLPFPDGVRDILREKAAVVDALSETSTSSDHFRMPGAVVLLLPVLLFPDSHLTWTAALIGIAALVTLVIASHRIAGRRALVLALAVPLTVPFTQGVLHGSVFVVVAASLAWTWLLLDRGHFEVAGILLGIAATARLWPLLLLVPIAAHRLWRSAAVAVGVFVVLNLVGLTFPGLSIEGTLSNLKEGSDAWLFAPHNGSLAAWLQPIGPRAAVVGFVIVLIVWGFGLWRVESLDGRMAWTLPAAMLASPLNWLPYLLALVPIAALYGIKRSTQSLLVIVFLALAVGYLWMPQRSVTAVAVLGIGAVVWIERDQPIRLRRMSAMSDHAAPSPIL